MLCFLVHCYAFVKVCKICVLTLCKYDRNESDDIQCCALKLFANVFLWRVRVPLKRKSEQLCRDWITGKVLLHVVTLEISQTKYLCISSPARDVAKHNSVKSDSAIKIKDLLDESCHSAADRSLF